MDLVRKGRVAQPLVERPNGHVGDENWDAPTENRLCQLARNLGVTARYEAEKRLAGEFQVCFCRQPLRVLNRHVALREPNALLTGVGAFATLG